MFKAICVAVALGAVVAPLAQATQCAVPCKADSSSGEHLYGYVMNTDVAAFDGVALSKSVRATAETAYLPADPTMRTIRQRRTDR